MQRSHFLGLIEKQLSVHPIVALLGPRQVGKTTLAQMYAEKHPKEHVEFFDLENPIALARLENPMLLFSRLNVDLVVIDEIQRRPDLFPLLRVLVDKQEKRTKFLILGSASRDLLQQSSESLAGRIGYIELTPFSLREVQDIERLWLRGGFPRSYLAANDEASMLWRQAYVATFLERDIPNLGFQIPSSQMRRFWMMLAHYHGQIFNNSELSRSLGISNHMVRKYLDILVGTFMLRQLPPWHENIGKRQVKSPKIYFRDSGILHTLLDIATKGQLEHYPRLGAFWEGFALEEVLRHFGIQEEAYFWSTQAGAELDLLLFKKGKRFGFEFKFNDAPKKTPSMHIALQDLKLDHLFTIYPGNKNFPIDENISAVSLSELNELVID